MTTTQEPNGAPSARSRRTVLGAAVAGLAGGAVALAGAARAVSSATTTATTAAAGSTVTTAATTAAATTAAAGTTAVAGTTTTAASATGAATTATAGPSVAAAAAAGSAASSAASTAASSAPTAAATTAPTLTATAAAGTGTAAQTTPAPAAASDPATPVAATPGRDLHHLLRRATYGPTPQSLAAARAQGWDAWLAGQLSPATVPDPVGDRIDALHPGLFLSIGGARTHYADKFWEMTHELVRWRVARSVWSTRQLHEVMSDLMHNHLNAPIGPDGPTGYAVHRYHHDVVRAHALGSFTDMLVASAEHPAMLHYLNANTSTRKAPNENYARELLELHTVGVGTHTEADVKAAALLLTGWRTRFPWENNGEPYTAWFDPTRHHVGAVTVLGRTYPNTAADGRAEIRAFLGDLARHPATARHLVGKLVRHFVADEPPATLVTTLAQVYLQQGTRLGPVLQALFTSSEFDAGRGTKIRRPLERYLATLRLLAPAPTAEEHLRHDGLVWLLPVQRPLSWPAPDGFPDVAVEWQSAGSALQGLNTASELVKGWVPVTGKQFTDAVLATPARDVDTITDEVCKRLLLRPAEADELDAARSLLAGSTVPAGPWSVGSWNRYRAVWYVTTLMLAHPLLLDR